MKIAVFLPNWIGDTVMATPALRGVRTHFADAEIVGVMRPYVADVLAGLELIDRSLFYNPRGRDPQQRGWRFVRQLRGERFDLALLLPNSWRSAWLAWISGAPRRVGFARDGRGWLLTDGVRPKPKRTPHPVIGEYLRLAAELGCKQLDRTMELTTSPDDERALERFWSRHPAQLRTRGVVCLNPGGAFGAAKHWPSEHFGALGRRIAEEHGRTVLVLCGPSERDEARQIVRHAAHPQVVSLSEEPPSLGLTKAAIRNCELLVTTDSGPRHFAQPFGVPVITLFGPTHIAWSETFYEKAVHLQVKLDCGPCQQRVCPLKHHRCMRELSVDQVYAAVCRALEQQTAIAKAS